VELLRPALGVMPASTLRCVRRDRDVSVRAVASAYRPRSGSGQRNPYLREPITHRQSSVLFLTHLTNCHVYAPTPAHPSHGHTASLEK
jgi:hypothetical protein